MVGDTKTLVRRTFIAVALLSGAANGRVRASEAAPEGDGWIAYPGDYALWRGNDLQARRIERGGGYPVFWATYAPHPLVDFTVDVDLDEPETAEIDWIGVCRITADIDEDPWTVPVAGVVSNRFVFPAGKYHLTARVYSQGRPPALRIRGKTVRTGSDWHADWRMAASGLGGVPSVPAEVLRAPGSLPTRQEPAVSVKRICGDHLLADFGRETFGFLRISGIVGSGRVRIIYGESEAEALCECVENGVGPDVWEIVPVGPAPEWRNPVSRGFRYVHVIPEDGVTVDAVSLDAELCPLARIGSFRSSDEALNRIWEVSARTLELTTRELFIEGAKRDRWTWSGDARQSYLMSYYLFGDQRLCKDTLFYQRGGDPVVMHLNKIPDYTYYWFLSVWEYYLHTGDKLFLEQVYDRMVSLMDFALGRLDAHGRPHDGYNDWVFIDWAPVRMDNKGGVCCFEQMLFVEALEALARVGEAIGRAPKEDYRARAAKLRADVIPTWWNEERGGLMHKLRDDGTLDGQFTRYPNMFGLAWGYFDAAKRERVLEDVIFNDDVMKIQTPYMRFYELEALLKLGCHEKVMEEMKAYWGGMLDEGATTFWESYDPAEKGAEKYTFKNDPRPYRKSLCHAWGAAPIYLIGRYYLGVEPTEPGFRRYVVKPRTAGLEWMEGTVPTPTGEIRVSVRGDRVTVAGCRGCEGELVLPDGRRERIAEAEDASAEVKPDFIPEGMTGASIQQAVDAAARAGGGRVVLKPGVFTSGTLYLRSHVELHLQKGAVLQGGSRPEDYDDVDDPRVRKAPEKSRKAFLVAIGCEDVALTGEGEIDGQGPRFYDTNRMVDGMYAKPSHPRTRMIEFVKCRGVRIEGVMLKDSPGWTCWLRLCEDVVADRVKICADQKMINNDGFHIDGCKGVAIRNCDLRTGDDCIVMRAIQCSDGESGLCEDLLVENCDLDSRCQCIRLGCPSDGTIRNGVFRNLRMRGWNGVVSGHPVRYLQDGDHGACRMRNLLVENCVIDVEEHPVSFWIQPGISLGEYGNVTFRKVRVSGGKPIVLQGTGDSVLTNVVFDDVTGTIAADCPLDVRSVAGLVFRNFNVVSGRGETASPAFNDSDGWERVR